MFVVSRLLEGRNMDRSALPAQASRPRVLMVDCHQDTLALYAIALSATGFDVMLASDTEQAFTHACETDPDVIVAEMPTPTREGRDLLERLRDDHRTRAIPILVVRGRAAHSASERRDDGASGDGFPNACLPHELGVALRRMLARNQSR